MACFAVRRIEAISKLVVVLPLVPVTPMVPQLLGRAPGQFLADDAEGFPAVRHQAQRHLDGQQPLGHDRGRAVPDGRLDGIRVMAVPVRRFHGDVHIAGLTLVRVAGTGPDPHMCGHRRSGREEEAGAS